MGASILEKVWKLRTDPFYPEIDANGVAIKREAIERTLNPLVDDRVLPYYFDVYDWTSSNLIGELSSQDALRVFPTSRTLPRTGALMVIISGSMETGIDSLANLVIHKIRLTAGHAPLVVDVVLEGRNKARNLLSVANRMIMKLKFDKPAHPDAPQIAKEMDAEYQRARTAEEGRKDATYSDLFMTFGELLKPIGRPVVLRIVEGGDNDNWVRIYDSVKSCCSYVIVMTPDYPYAKTCNDSMIALNRNVAWIRTRALDHARAHQYLAARLAAERVDAGAITVTPSLLPFTPSAIAALYEPAGGSPAPVTYAVGWLRRTLNQALTDRLEALTKTHGRATPQELAAIDPETTTIGAAEMKGVGKEQPRKITP